MSNSSSLSSGISEVYGESQRLGRFTAKIGAIIVTFIAILMIIAGIVFVMKKNPFVSTVMATVESVHCSKMFADENIYDCILNVTYIINGKKYSSSITPSDNKDYTGVKNIRIKYDPFDPTNAEVASQTSPRAMGIVLIVIGVIMIGLSWLSYYVTKKFKLAAAAEGLGTAYRLL